MPVVVQSFRSVTKLCDGLSNLADVFATLQIQLLGEIINCFFEIHVQLEPIMTYESSTQSSCLHV